MKKITAGITVIACVALCSAVWPRIAEVGDLPVGQVKTAVTAKIEARSEEKPHILISADIPTPAARAVTGSEQPITEITAEEKTEPAPKPVSKSAPDSTEPKPGDRTVIDGKPHVWIPGFGWIVDEGGGSIGTMVGNPGDQLTGNKVGIMGITTVGSDGDINKQVGIMGGGIVAEDMYENGHKTGFMGGDGSASSSAPPPTYAEPEITGDVIYTELQPPITKDSTPPAYKPNGEPYNP
mgnify:FL=1